MVTIHRDLLKYSASLLLTEDVTRMFILCPPQGSCVWWWALSSWSKNLL